MNQRVRKCAAAIAKQGLGALIVSDPVNVSYLSGFRPAEGYLLIAACGELIYLTNFLYAAEARQISGWQVAVDPRDIFTRTAEKIKQLKIKKVGFEAKHLPFLEQKTLKARLAAGGATLCQTSDLVSGLRSIKGAREIASIRKSVAITQEALEFIGEIHSPQMSEKELSIEIVRFLKLRGDNACAFPPIVAAGKNSSYPHHLPSAKQRLGSFFLTDLGSKHCGYCADLTRPFFWGTMPVLRKRVWDIIRKAQAQAIRKIKPGIAASQVDRAARDYIDKKGYGRYFGHGLGHGLGLSVHEAPYLNPHNHELLQEGMVITVEPAIYIPGRFGLRVEDIVLVKSPQGEVL